MTPHALVLRIRVFAILAVALAAYGAVGPFHVPSPMNLLLHGGCFYLFALLAMAALPWHRKVDVAFGLIALGVASEAVQGFFGRAISIEDVAADAVGVVLGAAPLWVARLRNLAQRHRFTTFAELRLNDRRRRMLAAAPRPAQAVSLPAI
jgi:hypothetical protein